jgi:hypothetical protein
MVGRVPIEVRKLREIGCDLPINRSGERLAERVIG